MSVYRDVRAFQTALDVSSMTCRADFLYMVKWAKVEDTQPYPNTDSLKAMVFAMHIGLLPESHQCQTCRRAFRLSYRQDSGMWEWSQQSGQCAACRRTRRSLTAGTVLEKIRSKNWLHFFDATCMWTLDYPMKIIERETGVHKNQLLEWEQVWHAAIELDLKVRLRSFALTAVAPQSANRVRLSKKPAMKKPGTAMKGHVKRPAASKGVIKHHLKRPSASKGIIKRPAKFLAKKQKATPNPMSFYKNYKYVIECDESHLNQSKPGALTRTGRVQADQVWVWGATLPRQPQRFVFKVLKHAQDAVAGRPRGKEEILECLKLLQIPKKTILVTDGWKATEAAVQQLKRDQGWSDKDLWHEVVNHSAGEIVNRNGFTTNHIENRWSVVKRWIRKRMGGRLPLHSNRDKWTRLLNEFHWRQIAGQGHSLDWGHTWYVPVHQSLMALCAYSAAVRSSSEASRTARLAFLESPSFARSLFAHDTACARSLRSPRGDVAWEKSPVPLVECQPSHWC